MKASGTNSINISHSYHSGQSKMVKGGAAPVTIYEATTVLRDIADHISRQGPVNTPHPDEQQQRWNARYASSQDIASDMELMLACVPDLCVVYYTTTSKPAGLMILDKEGELDGCEISGMITDFTEKGIGRKLTEYAVNFSYNKSGYNGQVYLKAASLGYQEIFGRMGFKDRGDGFLLLDPLESDMWAFVDNKWSLKTNHISNQLDNEHTETDTKKDDEFSEFSSKIETVKYKEDNIYLKETMPDIMSFKSNSQQLQSQGAPQKNEYHITENKKENFINMLNKGEKEFLLFNDRCNIDIQAMNQFFTKRGVLERDSVTFFKKCNVSDQGERFITEEKEMFSPENAICNIFKDKQGMIMGEVHESRVSKEYIITNMNFFKDNGVTTLYIEHLLSDLHQEDLDDYFSSAKNVMSARLEKYLKNLDNQNGLSGHNCSFYNLVKQAHNVEIKVVALDCTTSYCRASQDDLTETLTKMESGERHKIFCYHSKIIIDNNQCTQDAGKWIALIGATHTNYYLDTPGLAELTNAVSMRIIGSDKEIVQIGFDSGIKKALLYKYNSKRDGYSNKVTLKADLLLEVPSLHPYLL
jgi:hypothetical protein